MKRTHSPEYKLQVVRELLKGEKSLSQIGREQNLAQNVLRRWRQVYAEGGEGAFGPTGHGDGGAGNGNGKTPTTGPATDIQLLKEQQARIKALEQALGRAHLENEFLRDVLIKKGCPPPKAWP